MVKMQPHWLTPRTQQCVHLVLEEGPKQKEQSWRKERKRRALRITSHSQLLTKAKWIYHPNTTSQVIEEDQHLDTPIGVSTSESRWSCFITYKVLYGWWHSCTYVCFQSSDCLFTKSSHLKATNIKIIFYCCCLRLPLNDESKKKVEEMPNRHKKVQDLP